MKKYFWILLCLIPLTSFAQNEQIAAQYFEKGDFEKAVLSYEELIAKNPGHNGHFARLIESLQQLKQFDKAEILLKERLQRYKQPNLYVDLGYLYAAKKEEAKAKENYQLAVDEVRKNPVQVYAVANSFEKYVLLDYALQVYELATAADPRLNFNFQIAVIYGQQGKTDLMIEKFLDEAKKNPTMQISIQMQLSRFMMGEDKGDETFTAALRKALIQRSQKDPDIFWNEFLSWFYIQLKEYDKAFVQQKAIFKRNPDVFYNILNLANLAYEDDDVETAKAVYEFVLANTTDVDLIIDAKTFLLSDTIKNAKPADYPAIDANFAALYEEFGRSAVVYPLLIIQANYEAFNKENPNLGIQILKDALKMPLNRNEVAEIKMNMADILLFDEKYNQALLYYAQVSEDFKNDAIGHEANLKAAKTSYYQGDFTWAQQQFKALKSASTQLIANDALEMFLLISDNTVADSTQTDLKQLAKADFFLYRRKNTLALEILQSLLKTNKTQEILDVTNIRLGNYFNETGAYNEALTYYSTIISNFPESVYLDEALYASGVICEMHLADAEKAKSFYEKVIFNHPDSIFFVDARKRYRLLRGDKNL